jgi:hypothetical protein
MSQNQNDTKPTIFQKSNNNKEKYINKKLKTLMLLSHTTHRN